MSKTMLKLFSASLALTLGLGMSASSANAAVTYESVNVNGTTQTLSTGNVVTISDDNNDFWYGTLYSERAVYKTDGTQAGSFVKFAFSEPVESVKLYYAYLGRGDELQVSTNLGNVNLTQNGVVLAHNGTIVSSQVAGNLLATGVIESTDANDASGEIEIKFPQAITELTISAVPSGAAGGQPGINLVGLDVGTEGDSDSGPNEEAPEETPEETTPEESLADTGLDSFTALVAALLLVVLGSTLLIKSRRS